RSRTSCPSGTAPPRTRRSGRSRRRGRSAARRTREARSPPAAGSRTAPGRARTATAPRFSAPSRSFGHLHVDALLRLLELSAVAPVPHGDDLGEDRDRGLGLRLRAQVEPARPRDPGKLRLVDTRFEQPLAAALLVAA